MTQLNTQPLWKRCLRSVDRFLYHHEWLIPLGMGFVIIVSVFGVEWCVVQPYPTEEHISYVTQHAAFDNNCPPQDIKVKSVAEFSHQVVIWLEVCGKEVKYKGMDHSALSPQSTKEETRE